ncbi:peptide-methionine (S)-S-oxide reductase MsrA [Clostridium massiliamazoniense]|uniref:peptide-methionine (S)-S-oxide reductase MsrA n=1 Tax=Clostridium massiliamazoniense TaxID=1347366 RepID=UPI0006D7F9D1|nr:peptide-methionine (S)-S-oxide reductase MsrA [Clostridium massiliamazoniense]
MKEIVLAGGCFWGVEEFFSRIDGVIDTEVSYVNGRTENPTYEEICYGNTNYAEACLIKYNEDLISLEEILNKFWSIINPTSLNKQGNDVGSQYRTGIYYLDPLDLVVINKSKENIQKQYDKPIVTEVKPLEKYYKAEEYHQNYLKKNPNGYCHIKLD